MEAQADLLISTQKAGRQKKNQRLTAKTALLFETCVQKPSFKPNIFTRKLKKKISWAPAISPGMSYEFTVSSICFNFNSFSKTICWSLARIEPASNWSSCLLTGPRVHCIRAEEGRTKRMQPPSRDDHREKTTFSGDFFSIKHWVVFVYSLKLDKHSNICTCGNITRKQTRILDFFLPFKPY